MHNSRIGSLGHLGTADPESLTDCDLFAMSFEAIASRVAGQAARIVAAGPYPFIAQTVARIDLRRAVGSCGEASDTKRRNRRDTENPEGSA